MSAAVGLNHAPPPLILDQAEDFADDDDVSLFVSGERRQNGQDKLGDTKFTFLGQTLMPGAGKGDPVALRRLLEEKLGDTLFLKAYNVMNTLESVGALLVSRLKLDGCANRQQVEDEDALELKLVEIVGRENTEFLNVIAQLIFCEDRHSHSLST
ncbi:hypothetical protein T484DRAFT_1910247 [Baffinella frigidus]|nr:hypothetical protein T484DRAFT_1910247 [Cryptophyta sp. CCMP2293]